MDDRQKWWVEPLDTAAPISKSSGGGKAVALICTHVLVAVLAAFCALAWSSVFRGAEMDPELEKLQELKTVIENQYIGQVDSLELVDMAAAGMVAGTQDQWSYYIPASALQDHEDTRANSYVGIGVTVTYLEDDRGFLVQRLEPDSPAKEGGVLPGDVIVAVDGTQVSAVGSDGASAMIKGEPGTTVDITVDRDGQELTLTLTRKKILTQVATGCMVTDTVGYIRIFNFDDRCAQETIEIYEQLEQQGAQAFVFDVRFNPGGFKQELVELLDYLLPAGVLFQGEDYTGNSFQDRSDAACKQAPMAVLINADSYSAAEFFAAALEEYEYAITVGQATTGKGYFQNTIYLSDGSAVNLSVGKYYTPNGVSLAEVGGLVPQLPVEIDEETAALIYSQMLELDQDAQLQAAIAALEAES